LECGFTDKTSETYQKVSAALREIYGPPTFSGEKWVDPYYDPGVLRYDAYEEWDTPSEYIIHWIRQGAHHFLDIYNKKIATFANTDGDGFSLEALKQQPLLDIEFTTDELWEVRSHRASLVEPHTIWGEISHLFKASCGISPVIRGSTQTPNNAVMELEIIYTGRLLWTIDRVEFAIKDTTYSFVPKDIVTYYDLIGSRQVRATIPLGEVGVQMMRRIEANGGVKITLWDGASTHSEELDGGGEFGNIADYSQQNINHIANAWLRSGGYYVDIQENDLLYPITISETGAWSSDIN
jgi:hypothetical protein